MNHHYCCARGSQLDMDGWVCVCETWMGACVCVFVCVCVCVGVCLIVCAVVCLFMYACVLVCV